jgi:uroporphyrinogen III methyltransferase/synthase
VRVLVTRAAEDTRLFSFFLERAGFEPVSVPTIIRKWRVRELAAAIRQANAIDWIILTSSTAVDVLGAAWPKPNGSTRLAAIGTTTARRADELGLSISLLPEVFTREALVETMGSVDGQNIFYPRADLAPATVCDSLREAGATVTDVVAYTNEAPSGYAEEICNVLPVAITTLFSGSAASRVAEAVAPDQRHKLGVIAVVGPSTACAAKEAGLTVGAVATPHTIAGMVGLVQKIVANHSPDSLPQ